MKNPSLSLTAILTFASAAMADTGPTPVYSVHRHIAFDLNGPDPQIRNPTRNLSPG